MSIAQISPCQRHFLPLAARKIYSSIEPPSQHLVVLAGKSGNHVIRKALLCGLLQQLQMIQVLDTPNRNVFTCRHLVAHEVLKNDANLMIKVFQVILVQIDTIEQNLSFGRIVQARQQLDDRCLALAVLSNQSDPLSWMKMKIQVLDHHPHASRIPE